MEIQSEVTCLSGSRRRWRPWQQWDRLALLALAMLGSVWVAAGAEARIGSVRDSDPGARIARWAIRPVRVRFNQVAPAYRPKRNGPAPASGSQHVPVAALGVFFPANSVYTALYDKTVQSVSITDTQLGPTAPYVWNFRSDKVVFKSKPGWQHVCQLVKEQQMRSVLFLAMCDTDSQRWGWSVFRQVARLGVPVILWADDEQSQAELRQHNLLNQQTSSVILNLAPSIDYQCEAIVDFMATFYWQALTIVRTSTIDSMVVQTCNNLARQRHLQVESIIDLVSPLTTSDANRLVSQLSERRRSSRAVLLICNYSEAQLIFSAVAEATSHAGPLQHLVWLLAEPATRHNMHPDNRQLPLVGFPEGLIAVRTIPIGADMRFFHSLVGQVVNMWTRTMVALSQAVPNITWPTYNCTQEQMTIPEGATLTRSLLKQTFEWEDSIPLPDPGEALAARTMADFSAQHNSRTGRTLVAFRENGYLNYSELFFYNLAGNKLVEVARWDPISRVRLGGNITWPGRSQIPPKIGLSPTAKVTASCFLVHLMAALAICIYISS